MYLINDVIGAASRIVYGRKGDKVDILRKDIDICLVNNQGVRFFVRYENLSEQKVNPSTETSKEGSGKVQRTHKRKR